MCKLQGLIAAATVADHVIPHKGNEALFWNGELQSLCASHHNSDKKRIESGKQVLGCDSAGNPISGQSHWNAGGEVGRGSKPFRQAVAS